MTRVPTFVPSAPIKNTSYGFSPNAIHLQDVMRKQSSTRNGIRRSIPGLPVLCAGCEPSSRLVSPSSAVRACRLRFSGRFPSARRCTVLGVRKRAPTEANLRRAQQQLEGAHREWLTVTPGRFKSLHPDRLSLHFDVSNGALQEVGAAVPVNEVRPNAIALYYAAGSFY
jgi:hypothetical protein